jgi:uncharacterized protein YukE
MTMVGGNLEQLRMLEHQFTADAETVGDLQRRVTATLTNTTWTGPAADRFRQEWNGNFVGALTRLQEALADNAAVVRSRTQAIQQATA